MEKGMIIVQLEVQRPSVALWAGSSGLLDFVLHALRAIRPCFPCVTQRNGSVIG